MDQRYYSPNLGRFDSPDPSGIATANPRNPSTWNRYSYVSGDPVNSIDRHGLYTDDIDCLSNPDAPECTNPCAPMSEMMSLRRGRPMMLGPEPGCGPEVEDSGSDPVTAPTPSPTCDEVLTASVQSFLQTNDSALLSWDPNLAAQLVTVGAADKVDPRLMASIATLESGHGSVFGGQNNPFGLGPGLNFNAPLAAVASEGKTLEDLIGYGDKTVSALYSGLPGISNKSW